MATYRDIGPSKPVAVGVPDPGNVYGAGNWTVQVTQQQMRNYAALCEVYQISIDGPVGSSFKLYRNADLWNTVLQGWANNDDPFNPLFVRPGDTLFFYWNVAVLPAPTVTCWLRLDIDLPENKAKPIGG